MKKLILFFLLLSGAAYGQSNNTTNTKFTNGLAVPNGATQKPTSGLTAGALSYVTGVGLYVYNGSSWELLGLSSGGVTSFNGRTGAVTPVIGDYSSFYTPLTRSLTINGATQTLAADRTWTITANTPNSLTNGYGLTGGVFDGSVARTWVADTASVSGLVSKLRLATNLTGYVKKATTITINGVTQDLSDNRIWTAGTVTSVTPAYGLTPQTAITSSGSFGVDTLVLDTVYAKIGDAANIAVSSISNTPNNNGISYSNDTLRLHAVTPTTGGVLTNGIDSIGGDKFFTNDIWITDSQISDGHVGLASGSGSLHAPLLGASSESATNLLEILAHPAANRYNMNPANGIKFQVYINEGPDPITSGNAYNFKNGSSELLKISPLGQSEFLGDIITYSKRVSNGGISLGSGSGSLMSPILGANSESSVNWIAFNGFPATNIDNTNPTDAFRFNAYKSNDGSQALTGGNLVNFFNKDVSKLSVDYNGVITSAGLTNGLVKSTSGALSNATAGTDYTLLNGTGIVEMAGTTPSYLSSTGSGNVVKATSPTLTTPNIGNATGGTLSLSGTQTSTLGNNTTLFNAQSATTGYQFFNMQNTSGRLLWGIDGSAGGAFMTGGSAYSGAMTTVGAKNLEFGTDQTLGLKIDGTNRKITMPELGGAGDVIVGADNNGLLGEITVGSGLSLSAGVLTATGGISGSVTTAGGTAGKIAKFTSASNIENSIMTESSGLISIAGNIESTSGNNQIVFDSKSATTGYQYQHLKNTSGETIFGIEGSSAGTLLTNGSAYAGVLATVGSQNLELGTNQTKRVTIAHTTGDLTATGNISAANLSGTNTGDQTTITGNAGTATALQTARNIQGVSFNGTADINPINGTGFVKATGTTLSYDNTTYAPLNSPTFTGTPSLPTGTTGVTQTQGDNSNKLATTAYVDALGGTILGAQKQIATTYTNISTSGTSEESLFNHNIAQSNLSSDGDRIDFNFAGIFGLNASDKYVRISVGGNLIPISGNASNKSVWEIDGYLMRTSSTSFRIFIRRNVDYVYQTILSDYSVTDFNPLNFQILGQTNNASFPVTVQMGYLQSKKAP